MCRVGVGEWMDGYCRPCLFSFSVVISIQLVVIVIVVFRLRSLSVDVVCISVVYNAPRSVFMLEVGAL